MPSDESGATNSHGDSACGQTTCPACNGADAIFSIRRVSGLEDPKGLMVLSFFFFFFFVPLSRGDEGVHTVTSERVGDGSTCFQFCFFFQHLLGTVTLEAAFYGQIASVGPKLSSRFMYKTKGVAMLEWGHVGGVYRGETVCCTVRCTYSTYMSYVVVIGPPYVHVHT